MTTRPYELLARFAQDGTVAGVSVRTITTVDGRDFEGDPRPLSGASDAAFRAFAEQFAAAATTERDSLRGQLATAQQSIETLTSERDSALASLAELQGKAEELEAVRAELAAALVRIEELTPDEDPNAPFGVSKLLLRRTLRSMGLESMLNGLLASDPTILADWTDAPYLLSNDQILVGMIPVAAGMLGKTEAEVMQLLEAARMT